MIGSILHAGMMIKAMWFGVFFIILGLIFIPFAVLVLGGVVLIVMLLGFCARCVPDLLNGGVIPIAFLLIVGAITGKSCGGATPTSAEAISPVTTIAAAGDTRLVQPQADSSAHADSVACTTDTTADPDSTPLEVNEELMGTPYTWEMDSGAFLKKSTSNEFKPETTYDTTEDTRPPVEKQCQGDNEDTPMTRKGKFCEQ